MESEGAPMPVWRLCLALLLLAGAVEAFEDYDSVYNFGRVFERCALRNRTSSAATHCVCMNTVYSASTGNDSRRAVDEFSCLDCASDCSAGKCSQRLGSCESWNRGCRRLCLCRCPNVTTVYRGKRHVYIACNDWCEARAVCPSAGCKATKGMSWTTTVVVVVVVVCVVVAFRYRLQAKQRIESFVANVRARTTQNDAAPAPSQPDAVPAEPTSPPSDPSAPPPPFSGAAVSENMPTLDAALPSYYEATHDTNASPPAYSSVVSDPSKYTVGSGGQ